ncbi:hypothetical protein XELAEV_18023407mg [Xenopus laevis]|uniref:Uncharacterized protein n=1 Tax=Xenopus laevis TaxID=8355 RepID=A0A974D4Z4_XENLA|nr:hypothetical protein XELAEV_18023407mg [Xenopus laevis]
MHLSVENHINRVMRPSTKWISNLTDRQTSSTDVNPCMISFIQTLNPSLIVEFTTVILKKIIINMNLSYKGVTDLALS